MTNTVLIKRSATANSVPLAGNLSLGELALNYTDGNLFYKNSSNVVTVIASNKFLSVTGNVTAGNLSGTSIVGTLTTAAQTNITSVGTLTSLAVTGNISGGNLSGTSIVGTLTTAAQTNITAVGTLGTGNGLPELVWIRCHISE